jgi:hypothetical protein
LFCCRFRSNDLHSFRLLIVSKDAQSFVSESHCSDLLRKHLPSDFAFPSSCTKFDSFRSGIVRRDSKQKEENVAFAGMDPGAAIKAKSAREQGHPNEAQLIRRMSSRNNVKETSWF